ncbi:MAG TPA: hypothetical protein PKZ67_08015 [Accumulibacter sp.]|uniref:Uncharacterized protein n=1 Tax=Candidatus Accumulibacter cognatus TaxID=2954383 RepID=A0A7D5SN37_9PROT|nr:hypothetical protein [Accumulibacter sp.]MBL8402578.1 hypothetical protein [Accumulibacter sp.]QLH50201.1 MAG: hypothetical protein HWD57_10740 [Candidatus Accumulibacter cognatus]HNC21097.1 hypothetical protein [Accumulibacter sp.]HNF92141.1 hypothetical protein [Accumulibacter sp.]
MRPVPKGYVDRIGVTAERQAGLEQAHLNRRLNNQALARPEMPALAMAMRCCC